MAIKRIVPVVALGLIAANPVMALELDIRPGKWGMTSTATMPMVAQPMEQYEEQCIAEGFDPVADLESQMAQMGTQCSITVTEDTASEFQADISCPVPGMGTMSGNMSFSASGDTVNGSSLINMTVNGQTMQVTTSSEGQYLGPCD